MTRPNTHQIQPNTLYSRKRSYAHSLIGFNRALGRTTGPTCGPGCSIGCCCRMLSPVAGFLACFWLGRGWRRLDCGRHLCKLRLGFLSLFFDGQLLFLSLTASPPHHPVLWGSILACRGPISCPAQDEKPLRAIATLEYNTCTITCICMY